MGMDTEAEGLLNPDALADAAPTECVGLATRELFLLRLPARLLGALQQLHKIFGRM